MRLEDPMQRLTGMSRPSGQVAYAYTKGGNVTQKSDFGVGANAYSYPAGKHGVAQVALPQGLTATYSYDANGNVIGGNTLLATYDPDNRLRVIDRAYLLSGPGDKIFCNGFDDGINHCTNPPGGGTTQWTYGTNGERSTEQSSQGLRFFGPDGYELINGQSKHELGPVLVTRTGASDAVSILLKDRLGSIVTTIDGASATLRTYDAFGAARNGNMTPRFNGTLNLNDTIHGFTGHTHADDVGLIFMRGRVYDPNLGRFLSVDPIVGNTLDSQAPNPYSYLANRPLSGTDPTGYEDCTVTRENSCTVMNNDSRSADKLGHTMLSMGGDNNVRAYGSTGGAALVTDNGGNGAVGGGIKGPGGQTSQNVSSTEAGRTANNTIASTSGNAMSGDAQLLSTISVSPTAEERADALVGGDAQALVAASLKFAFGVMTSTNPWHRNAPGDDSIEQATLPGVWGMGAKSAAMGLAALRDAKFAEETFNVLPDIPPEALRFLSSGRESQVYRGFRNGEAAYCGISCNVSRRDVQHGDRFDISAMSPMMPRGQARAIEQAMILRNPQFENLRNSISPAHAYYNDAVRWGESWLQSNGFPQ